LYAVPPYTTVYPLEFTDVPFRIEDMRGWVDRFTGAENKFMTQIPLPDGSAAYEISDTGYIEKLKQRLTDASVQTGSTYFDHEGKFYIDGYLK
jgi:alpha-D-ribose 1-methylphosphonate 5-phosphate C-P lyase